MLGMKKRPLRLLPAVCLLLLLSGVSQAARYEFETLDYPSAVETYASGIDGSNVVGVYRLPDGLPRGFHYDGDATWTTLVNPNDSVGTRFLPNGIDGSNIVGYYHYNVSADFHGFLYDGGSTWTWLDYPGAVDTYAKGIDGNNIVGSYTDSSGEDHGFLYDGVNTWTSLDYPGAISTYASGISGNNIVGDFSDADGWHGFLYDKDAEEWTQLDYPDALETYASGVDGNNIVGSYATPYGSVRGFFYDKENDDWISLRFPGAWATDAFGIDGSNIVGSYKAVGNAEHGFVAQPAPELAVSPTSYDFGGVTMNSCSDWNEFTLSNPSQLDVEVYGLTVYNAYNEPETTNYELNISGGSQPCSNPLPLTLEPGDLCTITVRFCPATAGYLGAYLSVTSNDPVSPTDVAMAGTGKCTYSISPSSVSLRSNGGRIAVKVTATGADSCAAPGASSSDAWITPSRTRWRNNSGVVVLIAGKNTETSGRTGYPEIEGNVLTVTQAGARK